jgi:hypothetical protein
VTDFFLPRHDQKTLLEQLRQVPALVEDLTIAITRQDRITARGPKTSRGDDTQPLPFNEHASDAARYLEFVLANWAAFTCYNRGIDYDGRDNVISVARWLRVHIIDLALCPGAEESLPAIRDAVRNGNRACNGAHDRAVIVHSPHDVARARYSVLHAKGVEAAVRELGPEYRTLTEQRVYRLARAGVITPDRTITLDGRETALYVLGDVLDAHLKYPSRQRKAVSA